MDVQWDIIELQRSEILQSAYETEIDDSMIEVGITDDTYLHIAQVAEAPIEKALELK